MKWVLLAKIKVSAGHFPSGSSKEKNPFACLSQHFLDPPTNFKVHHSSQRSGSAATSLSLTVILLLPSQKGLVIVFVLS